MGTLVTGIVFLLPVIMGLLLAYVIFFPLQGQMGLNLIAFVEPYFRSVTNLQKFQSFMVIYARFLLFPFYIFLGYRIFRPVFSRMAKRGRPRRDSRTSCDESEKRDELTPEPLTNVPGKNLHAMPSRSNSCAEEGLSALWDKVSCLPCEICAFLPLRLMRCARSVEHVLLRFGRLVLGWATYAYGIVCLLFFSLQFLLFLGLICRAAAHPIEAVAFSSTCSQCHSLFRPLNYNLTASIWETTVKRMARHASVLGVSFPTEKQENIVEFLCAIRSYSSGQLVRSKCYRCHTPFRIFSRRRCRIEWTLLIDRIQRQNPFYITERQADEIVNELARKHNLTRDDPPTGTESFKQLQRKVSFERKCGTCHTLDIIFLPDPLDGEWGTILFRMGGKAPDVLSRDEALSYTGFIAELLAHKEGFHSRYPHSVMREYSRE